MLATVAGEVAVVAVDHREAGAHIAGEIEGGDAGTQGEGSEGVPEIVDSPERLDPGCELCRFPVAVAEVVQIDVAAALGREEQVSRLSCGSWSTAASALACSGTARLLASVFGKVSLPLLKERWT